ncbi:hypothetical protein PF003_g3141 [Phytophthora fragariae]|nr:hypothetical protein PF003_g3141 [Phytophthora fragariae]
MGYEPWLSQGDVNANASQLGAYAVYLWRFGMNRRGQGNTYSTVCGKLCAVRWYHKNTAGYDPGVNASHAILLRGIRRFTSPVVKQQPLTPKLLRLIVQSLNLCTPHDQLLWGGLLLGYVFLLRRSEYLFIGRRHHDYILRLKDIRLLDAAQNDTIPRHAVMVSIRLTGAKNNQYGEEEERFHFRSGDAVLCPVKAARWIKKAATTLKTNENHPALSMSAAKGVNSKDMANIVKSAARAAGLDPARFSTHSVRIGGATSLLNSGADRLVLKVMGRWLSNAFEAYPVLTASGSKHLAQLMC